MISLLLLFLMIGCSIFPMELVRSEQQIGLAEYDPDINTRDLFGNTPLLIVLKSVKPNLVVVQELLKKSADTAVRNRKNKGVLDYVLKSNKEKSIQNALLKLLFPYVSHDINIEGLQERLKALRDGPPHGRGFIVLLYSLWL